MKMQILSRSLICVLALALSACAGYSPTQSLVGQNRSAVIQLLGQPEREYPSEGKTKLQFPRGPGGSHTYFVYLDKEGQVLSWEQVLTEERFNQVSPGMTQEQVIDLIGVSTITFGLARERGYVWHYRYWNPGCASFVIEFTKEATVRSAGYLIRGGRKCKYVGQ
jgi:hypothetical protein